MAYSGGAKLSAVDAILAEAADLVALEQIAKLNTAHLADDDSALPSSLESRFRKLKSLPAAPPPLRTLARSVTAPHPVLPDPPSPRPNPPHAKPPAPPTVQEEHEQPPPGAGEADAAEKKGDSPSPSPRHLRPPGAGPTSHAAADDDLERLFGSGTPRGRPTLRERNRGRDDEDGGSLSPPPPRQACCFGFSPRKPTPRSTPAAKKVHGSGGSDVLGVDAGEWGDENRRVATELRDQQRRLRKALQEQMEVSRETAKMARWVKQASARMTHTAAIDDLLSDGEDDEELK